MAFLGIELPLMFLPYTPIFPSPLCFFLTPPSTFLFFLHQQVETFLLMYRAHCQRILDSVVRANFHEVQDFLVHFWQGMPPHIQPILKYQETADLVVICDFILYNVSAHYHLFLGYYFCFSP